MADPNQGKPQVNSKKLGIRAYEKKVRKATSEVMELPKRKYLELFIGSLNHDYKIKEKLGNLLLERWKNKKLVISMKALILTHVLISQNTDFLKIFTNIVHCFQTDHLKDDPDPNMAQMARICICYSTYINSKLMTVKRLADDPLKSLEGNADILEQRMQTDKNYCGKFFISTATQFCDLVKNMVPVYDNENKLLNQIFILLFKEFVFLYTVVGRSTQYLLNNLKEMNFGDVKECFTEFKTFCAIHDDFFPILKQATVLGILNKDFNPEKPDDKAINQFENFIKLSLKKRGPRPPKKKRSSGSKGKLRERTENRIPSFHSVDENDLYTNQQLHRIDSYQNDQTQISDLYMNKTSLSNVKTYKYPEFYDKPLPKVMVNDILMDNAKMLSQEFQEKSTSFKGKNSLDLYDFFDNIPDVEVGDDNVKDLSDESAIYLNSSTPQKTISNVNQTTVNENSNNNDSLKNDFESNFLNDLLSSDVLQSQFSAIPQEQNMYQQQESQYQQQLQMQSQINNVSSNQYNQMNTIQSQIYSQMPVMNAPMVPPIGGVNNQMPVMNAPMVPPIGGVNNQMPVMNAPMVPPIGGVNNQMPVMNAPMVPPIGGVNNQMPGMAMVGNPMNNMGMLRQPYNPMLMGVNQYYPMMQQQQQQPGYNQNSNNISYSNSENPMTNSRSSASSFMPTIKHDFKSVNFNSQRDFVGENLDGFVDNPLAGEKYPQKNKTNADSKNDDDLLNDIFG